MDSGSMAGPETEGGSLSGQGPQATQLKTMQRMASSSSQVSQLMGLQRRVSDQNSQGLTSYPAPAMQRETDSFEITAANKGAFLGSLKKSISNVADATLAQIGQTSQDCPYIAYWFSFYADKEPAHIQTSISKYLKGDVVGSESAIIEKITTRVQQALAENVRNGSLAGVPDDVPKDLEEKQIKEQKEKEAAGVKQFCFGKTSDVQSGLNRRAINAARAAYDANPSLALANEWQRVARQERQNAGGFVRLNGKDQAYIRSQFEAVTAAIQQRQLLEQGQERQDRAIDTAAEIEEMRTQGVNPGEVDNHIINDYTNPDTGRAETFFNRPLRNRDMTEEQADGVRRLQEALLRSEIDPQQELWRGTNHLIGGNNAPVVGETYKEQGFFSTSRHRNVAAGFGSMLIHIVSHRNGRNILSLGGDEYGGGEEEVLFPAGSEFIYDGVVGGAHQYREV